MTEKIPKIFISYTVRDGKINKDFLNKLENKISPISNVYIDLIHNNSQDKQKRVMIELKSSDMIFLIKTEEINESKWVKKEISLANKKGIPIYEFEFDDIIKTEFLSIKKVITNIKSLLSIPVQLTEKHKIKMTLEDYNKNYCLEFDFAKLGLNKYEYFLNQIDKSSNNVKIIHITYDEYQLESVFDSTDFTKQLILDDIKIGLVKGLLGLLKIDYNNKNLNDLFCTKN